MTINASNISVCQEALYLLRQDVDLPTVETAASDTSLEWRKCQMAFATAIAEVWNAHDWVRSCATATATDATNWSDTMRTALVYCVARELAIPLAGRVEDLKNWDGLYRDKLMQARVAALQTELDAVSDTLHKPVLRLLLPNFGPGDQDLPRSIKSYTDRIDAEKEAARSEVWNAHDWVRAYATATSAGVNWNAGMSDALTYLLASKLAMPTARKEGEPQGYDQLYRDKLMQARVAALEAERKTITEPLKRDLIALLVPQFDPKDDHLPRSLKAITDRADALADGVRRVVLSVHPWNFAHAEDPTPSCHVPHGCDPYAFASEVPAGCARLLAVYTHGGRLDDWKVFGTQIAARAPVVKAVYIRDDKRPDKWPAAIRRLYLYRLAADTAQTEVPKLVELLETKYAAALRDAKAEDARESSTPKDAWGRNHYVDAMRGVCRDGPHLPHRPFHRLY